MVMPGETIATGAEAVCSDCAQVPKLGVYRSQAGYYIGAYCACGPYSRESEYYETREAAEEDFKKMRPVDMDVDAVEEKLVGEKGGNAVRNALKRGAARGILCKP
jgi:hypothetical protein